MKAIDLLNQLQELQKENPAIFDTLQIELFDKKKGKVFYIEKITITKLFNQLLINLEEC